MGYSDVFPRLSYLVLLAPVLPRLYCVRPSETGCVSSVPSCLVKLGVPRRVPPRRRLLAASWGCLAVAFGPAAAQSRPHGMRVPAALPLVCASDRLPRVPGLITFLNPTNGYRFKQRK